MTTAHFLDLLRTARQQIKLAAAVYAGRSSLMTHAVMSGARFRSFSLAHIAAAALVFDDHVHLTIGGTNDRYDWTQNLSASQQWYHDHSVHSGFATAAEIIAGELRRSKLRDLIGDRRLIIGGHSAGGAIAQLVALQPEWTPSEVVTFGSPRVFSPESAADYRAQSWETHQFVADGDPVPHFPLRRFRCLFGRAEYSYTESPLVIKVDGRVVTDRDSGVVSRVARFAAAWWIKTSLLSAVFGDVDAACSAHSVAHYEQLIHTAIERSEPDA